MVRLKTGAVMGLVMAVYAAESPSRTVEWISDESGRWSEVARWTGRRLPATFDDVIIDRPDAAPEVLFDRAPAVVNSIFSTERFTIGRLETAQTIALTLLRPSRFLGPVTGLCCVIESASTIDFEGELAIGLLTLRGRGVTRASGGVRWLDTWSSLSLEAGHTFENVGTITVGILSEIVFFNGGVFRNGPTGTIDVVGGGISTTVRRPDSTVLPTRIQNDGTIRITSGSFVLGSSAEFRNTGTIRIDGGSLGAGGTFDGLIQVGRGGVFAGSGHLLPTLRVEAEDGVVWIYGPVGPGKITRVEGRITANELGAGTGASEFTGHIAARTLTVNGYGADARFLSSLGETRHVGIWYGSARFDTGESLTFETFRLDGGARRLGGDTIDVSGTLYLGAGSLVGSGSTHARAGMLFSTDVEGHASLGILEGHTLVNHGDGRWAGNYPALHLDSGAAFVNEGTLLLPSYLNVEDIESWRDPRSAFRNFGVIRQMPAEAGRPEWNPVLASIRTWFENHGEVEIAQRGVVQLGSGGRSTGSYVVGKGGELRVAGDHLFEAGASVDAAEALVAFGKFNGGSNGGLFTVRGAYAAGSSQLWGALRFEGAAPQLGRLEVNSGSRFVLQGSTARAALGVLVPQGGTVIVDRDSVLHVGPEQAYVQTFVLGRTHVDGLLSSPVIRFDDGRVSGTGILAGSVSSGGRIEPGAFDWVEPGVGTFGRLRIDGDFRQTATGVIALDVGGEMPGENLDVLHVSGRAFLDGTLRVRMAADFHAKAGDVFDLLWFGSREGSLEFELEDTRNSDLVYSFEYGADRLSLRVAAVPEPRTWLMLATGGILIFAARRKRLN